jgi:hypothetical protein
VLSNVSDIDGDTLTPIITSVINTGELASAVVNATTKKIDYIVANNFE